VGLGNLLSGDDAFGPQVLDRLRQCETKLPPGVIVLNAHTDLLNYIEDFAGYGRIFLIDAILDPEGKLGKPGSIVVLDEEEFQSWSESSPSVHQMSPLLAVKLFRSLHPEAPTGITLVGLLVDQLTHQRCYATEDRIEETVAKTRLLLLSERFESS
jgi:hydrogenase maturation protease